MSRENIIVKNTSFLYIRMIIVMFLTLFTSRVVIGNLGITDYGLYNVVGGFVIFFAFINTALSVSTQRFLSFELGKSHYIAYIKTFWTSVIVYVGIGFILFLTLLISSQYLVDNFLNIPENRIYACYIVFYTSIVSLFFMMIQSPFCALLVANEKFNAVAYIGILEVVLKLLAALLLCFAEKDRLIFYGVILAVSSAIIMLVYVISCICLFRNVFQLKYLEINFGRGKEILCFSFWNLWASLSIVACNQGVNILLNIFFTPVVNAARAVSMQVNSAVYAFVANIHSAIIPQQTKSYAAHDNMYFEQISLIGCKASFFLISVLIIPLFFYSEMILHLWLDIVPESTSTFVRLVLINTLIDPTGGITSGAVQATGNIRRYQFGVGLIYLMNLPISYLILQIVKNPICVFYVAIVMTFVGFIFRIFYLKNILGCTFYKLICYFSRVYISVILLFIVGACLHEFMQISFYGFILYCIEIFFVSCIIYYFIGINKREKNMFRKLIYSIKSRIIKD